MENLTTLNQNLTTFEEIKEEEIKEALNRSIEIVNNNLPKFFDKFPSAASTNGFYEATPNDDWTNGFWTGQLWLSYEATQNDCFKEAALHQVDDYYQRIIKRIVVDHHDMGFLYSPSCVAAYQLTGSETGKAAAILAADNLLSRFQEKGNFFQAWGKVGAEDNYRFIIDSLLNMPLLFWATKVTGEEKYKEKAIIHIQTVMKYVLRPDYSTYHTYYFDPKTGDPIKGVTCQGNRNNSIWARGQAWGIYGAALSYGQLKNEEYITLFEKICQCFISHLPSDLIPYWDFDFTDGSTEPRDSSSAAIAACGMLEMAEHLPEEKGQYYISIAKKLLSALTKQCMVKENNKSNGILLHATYAKQSEFNQVNNSGVDECNIWGDYFYMEALTRLSKNWNKYW